MLWEARRGFAAPNMNALSPWSGRDAYFSSVVLLCGFEGADASTSFTDESNAGRTLTANGNAQIDTAQFKFGASSALFDGSGDFISASDSDDWSFGSGEFTIETFVRYSTVADAEYISQYDLSSAVAGWKFGQRAAVGLAFDFYDSGGTLRSHASAWTPSTNTWYHVAVDRDSGGVVRLYVDGGFLAKLTLNQTFRNSTKALNIGRIDHTTPRYLNGWLDEVRITKGVARYASDAGFTAPTAVFPRA